MDTKALRQKILDLAIHGRLVPQDPNDEPASVLLERIRDEKERLIKEGKIKRSKKSATASDTPHYENVPFEVPDSWVWCRLNEIADSSLGKTLDQNKNTGKEYPYLCAINVKWDDFDFSVVKTIKLDDNEKERYLVKRGDLLICEGGDVGRSAIWTNDEPIYYQNALHRVRFFDKIITKFYLYLIWCYKNYNWIDDICNGVTIKHFTQDKINSLLFPLPPLPEQHRIVAEIEKWFALIDQIEQGKASLQTTIKQTKSKILDLAIHGRLVLQDPSDEPAIEHLKRICPGFTPCDNGRGEMLPQGWCISRLKELCACLSRGKSPKYSDIDRTIPVFAQKCNLKGGGISLEQAKFLDPSTIGKWSEVYKLRTGDILINSTGTGTVGRTRLFKESCLGEYPFVLPDSHISVVRAAAGIIPQYLFAYITSNKIQYYIEDNLAGSTNQKELYIGVLEQMEIFVPPLPEQHRIAAKIEELFSALDNIQKALEA